MVTPQLENLTIARYFAISYQVSAPALASLHFIFYCPERFSTDGFHSLKEVVFSLQDKRNPGWPQDAQVIISMLQQFHSETSFIEQGNHSGFFLSFLLLDVHRSICIYIYILFFNILCFSTASEFIRGTHLRPTFPVL